MVHVMGDKCQICGYDKCLSALEFHHIVSEEKLFGFNKANNTAWETIIKELEKCILVCANCHREIESGMINKELKTSFIPERAEEISYEISQLKTHKIYYCKYCGAIVTYKNDCCQKCSSILRQKVERPSREELKNLIRTQSFVQIGKNFGVSDNAIRKWCKNYKLPSAKTEINKYSNEEWLKI